MRGLSSHPRPARGGLALLPLFALALAASFAAFTVEPAGDQVVDLTTGVTTLPSGGKLVDAERGLTLVAAFIEYKEGAFVRAKKARLARKDVRFFAGSLEYRVPEEEVRLAGGVEFSSAFLKGLSAEAGTLYLKDEVAVLSGRVKGEDPAFTAARLVADTRTGEVLLLGDFRYRDPGLGLELTGKGKNARLYLKFEEGKEPEASTEVPEAVLKRLSAYLEE